MVRGRFRWEIEAKYSEKLLQVKAQRQVRVKIAEN